MTTLTLPLTDVGHLRRRVRALAENRPAVYRMIDASGRVVYVGKAKRLRNRLLSYFRANYPEDKAARIVHAAADIQWDLMPSEFAALLAELSQIRRYRPVFNVRMNRNRRLGFIKVSDGPAPKLYVGSAPGPDHVRHYGPFSSVGRLKDSVKVLNDLLQLRDCALKMPLVFPGQGDLFTPDQRAACIRFELGNCAGPCAGLVSQQEYSDRVGKALGFLENTSIEPLHEVVTKMTAAGERRAFELAAHWRDRFDSLEWLLAVSVRAHASVTALSFVYIDPGMYGDDRAYVIKHGTVRASAPSPHTPIEREAFDALVLQHIGQEPACKAIPAQSLDETVLLLQWFRRHPSALSRTVRLEEWCERGGAI